MRFFRRGETVDVKFLFQDIDTGNPIDVLNARYKIVHYDGGVEVIDVPETPLTKVGDVGHYVANWVIPLNAPENESYFAYGKGDHPTHANLLSEAEDYWRVLPSDFFSGGGGGGRGGIVAKFTKP